MSNRAPYSLVDPTYEQSHAARLRGRRFWVPFLALLAATTIALVAFGRTHKSPIPLQPPAAAVAANADPTIRALLARLDSSQLFCGSLQVLRPDRVQCRFGAASAPATIQSFPDHRSVLRALPSIEKAAATVFSRTGAVTWLSTNHNWVATGLWSSTGSYAASRTADGLAAQSVSQQLNGCLELLPKQAGSCSF